MSRAKTSRLLFISGILLLGCTANQTQRVEVAGKVQLDGEPLSMGTIRFVPGAGRPVSSEIQSDGSFTLVSAGQGGAIAGVVPGLYRVAVSSSEILDEDAGPIWHAPAKYADHRTSGIEVIIDEPTQSLVIELESEVADEETSEPSDSEAATTAGESNES